MTLLCPLPGLPAVTSGYRTPARPDHCGVDLRAPVGTPVVAPEACVVRSTGWTDSGGRHVTVRSLTRRWTLCHLLDFQVHPGDVLERGQAIGHTGESGRVTGPHLHLELRPLRPDGTAMDAVDPYPVLLGAERWEVEGEGAIGQSTAARVTT